MAHPTVFVAMPVYRGQEFIGEALHSLMTQEFGDFHAVISVDGADRPSAELCAAIVANDARFEIVVHEQQLGWAGNLNWLMARSDGEFFQYWQQDDHCAPSYLRHLVSHATSHPEAACVYGDMVWFGRRNEQEHLASVTGPALARVLSQIERGSSVPFRGLVRRTALSGAGPLRLNEFDSRLEDFVWVATLAREGELHRVPAARYFKRVHGHNTHSYRPMPSEVRRSVWINYGVGILGAAWPLVSDNECADLMLLVLERLLVARGDRWMTYDLAEGTLAEAIQFGNDFLEAAAAQFGVGALLLRLPDALLLEKLRSHGPRTSDGLLAALAHRETVFATLQQTLAREGVLELPFSTGEPAAALLEHGWSSPEPWGVWTNGTTSGLRLPIPPRSGRWMVELDVQGFVKGLEAGVAVAASVRGPGLPETRWAFTAERPRATHAIEVESSLGSSGVIVEFDVAEARSPRTLGLSDDARMLGLGLARLIIRGQPTHF